LLQVVVPGFSRYGAAAERMLPSVIRLRVRLERVRGLGITEPQGLGKSGLDSPFRICRGVLSHSQGARVDVKDVVSDPEDAPNPTDDARIAVLEDYKDDRSGPATPGPAGCHSGSGAGVQIPTSNRALRRTDQ
jgi:hypothetical protein